MRAEGAVVTLTAPFFTEMDPRLQVRGSRDALGGQAVWATIGRQLIGNLTLSSNDAAGFRTLLIGYGLAGETKDMDERVRVFLRWEQAAAAARVATSDKRPPLGARRVRRRLNEAAAMTLSEERQHQIFIDQRGSGLWVLYHRAARDSGLVDESRKLTDSGRGLYQMWLDHLPPVIVSKVTKTGEQSVNFGRIGTPSQRSVDVASVLRAGVAADRAVLRAALVSGLVPDRAGGTKALAEGRQQLLARLLAQGGLGDNWRERVPALVQRALASGHASLATRLEEVLIAESVLLPAQGAFDNLLVDGHGSSVAVFANRLRRTWPRVPKSVRASDFKTHVHPRLVNALGNVRADAWAATAEAMAAGEWDRAVQGLIDINVDTMVQRGGAPWVRTGSKGVLEVRLPVGTPLPSQEEILEGWRNAYYLDALLAVQRDLRSAGPQ